MLKTSSDTYVLVAIQVDSADDISEYNKHLYMQMLNSKMYQEHEMSSPQYQSNRMLNDDISFDEVQKITNRLKNNKSSGIDKVPNE